MSKKKSPFSETSGMSRRDMLKTTAALSAAVVTGAGLSCSREEASQGGMPVVQNGRIKQVLTSWPFMDRAEFWTLNQLCQAAVDLGCAGIELVGPEEWPTMQEYGLVCGMSTNGMPGLPFEKGLNNMRYQAEVVETTIRRIEECAAAGVENVIAFNGNVLRDLDNPDLGEIPLDEGADNTVEGLKLLASHAEEHGVTVCLEHLNTRNTDPHVFGTPGYQGDDIDYCADIVRRVGSPRVKLLFDIYHVQIMNGDVIARIHEYGTDLIGHIHTAGVPGRIELGDSQELNYPAIMQALVDIGYEGYVGQEFVPTRPPMEGLREAVALCDV
ncbi:MAG: TIM barrel protein [Balneolaceae bacterium]